MSTYQQSVSRNPLVGLILSITSALLIAFSPVAFSVDFSDSLTDYSGGSTTDFSGELAECSNKSEYAGTLFDGRDQITLDVILKELEDGWRNNGYTPKWWKVVDMQRIAHDVYRKNRKGEYYKKDRTKFMEDELTTCLYETAFPNRF